MADVLYVGRTSRVFKWARRLRVVQGIRFRLYPTHLQRNLVMDPSGSFHRSSFGRRIQKRPSMVSGQPFRNSIYSLFTRCLMCQEKSLQRQCFVNHHLIDWRWTDYRKFRSHASECIWYVRRFWIYILQRCSIYILVWPGMVSLRWRVPF